MVGFQKKGMLVMKLNELLKNTLGTIGNTEIKGVTSDSRKVCSGYAFVCIKGTVSDGHDYAKTAADKGAAVIIASKDLDLANQIIVSDTREAYAEMCAKWFGEPAKRIKIIGITGTNGKTSISYMLKSIFEHCGHKVGLIGTINNMIGNETIPTSNTTPDVYTVNELLYRMCEEGCDYCVMEVSSHALDQGRVHGIRFTAAVFTNLTQDHLDYHKTMDNYCDAKRKLFEQCDLAIMNHDDPYKERLIEGLNCRVCTYSTISDESTYSAKEIRYKPDGIVYHFVGYNLISRVKLSTAGRFSVYNSMAAVSCAVELGVHAQTASDALALMKGVKGRAEVVPTGRDFTVIIDYAHTPDGLENILNTFNECEKNRLVAVFGCGGDRDGTKRPQMGEVAASIADYVIVTSDNPRTEDPEKIIDDITGGMKGYEDKYTVIPDRIAAIKYAVKNAKSGDIVVLAGKGHETYQILKDKTIHLDEREIVAEALEELKLSSN